MIRLKTAVMLGACLKTGAILGGAGAGDADKLYDFGIHTGLAFQIKDDLLDVFGDPAVFGKNIGGDILCNKKTFLLIHALNKVQGEEKEQLLRWLQVSDPEQNDAKIRAVTDIYRSLRLEKLSELKMQHYYQLAMDALDALHVSPKKTDVLRTLAQQLTNRKI